MEGRQPPEIADGERNRPNVCSKGNEWEVVSLTASVYAAAPSPLTEVGTTLKSYSSQECEEEAYRAMFMSDHFVFPPNQHENLPLEPLPDATWQAFSSQIGVEEEGGDETSDETSDGSHVEFSNEGGEGGERRETPCLKGHSLDRCIFNEEAEVETTLLQGVSYPVPPPQETSKSTKDADFRKPGSIPREIVWWRRRASCFYTHVKHVNTFWSIVITAAVMGIVVFGHQWHRERLQALQLKWKSGVVGGAGAGLKEITTVEVRCHGCSFSTAEGGK